MGSDPFFHLTLSEVLLSYLENTALTPVVEPHPAQEPPAKASRYVRDDICATTPRPRSVRACA